MFFLLRNQCELLKVLERGLGRLSHLQLLWSLLDSILFLVYCLGCEIVPILLRISSLSFNLFLILVISKRIRVENCIVTTLIGDSFSEDFKFTEFLFILA